MALCITKPLVLQRKYDVSCNFFALNYVNRLFTSPSILRLDVFSELHTITQFEGDSRPILPIILAGQNNLIDNLMYRQAKSLASRVVARGHLEALNQSEMNAYLMHHLDIAGVKQNLFAEQAVTAIHQGSGGLLRRANNLARGALIAAAAEKCDVVSAEHVRVASTEII